MYSYMSRPTNVFCFEKHGSFGVEDSPTYFHRMFTHSTNITYFNVIGLHNLECSTPFIHLLQGIILNIILK